MILKDLRISPLRNILTGISMFVGIIAMISSVLVGTLGKEYLISVNAQMYGWSPTYSFSITGSDFQDTIKMENFFREIYNTDHFVAVTFSMLEEITVLLHVRLHITLNLKSKESLHSGEKNTIVSRNVVSRMA